MQQKLVPSKLSCAYAKLVSHRHRSPQPYTRGQKTVAILHGLELPRVVPRGAANQRKLLGSDSAAVRINKKGCNGKQTPRHASTGRLKTSTANPSTACHSSASRRLGVGVDPRDGADTLDELWRVVHATLTDASVLYCWATNANAFRGTGTCGPQIQFGVHAATGQYRGM